MGANETEGVCYVQPTTLAARAAIARDFIERTKYRLPMLIDSMDNDAEAAFAAWPERLYVIDEQGRIAYKGGTGPFDFKPDELEAWLERRLNPRP